MKAGWLLQRHSLQQERSSRLLGYRGNKIDWVRGNKIIFSKVNTSGFRSFADLLIVQTFEASRVQTMRANLCRQPEM